MSEPPFHLRRRALAEAAEWVARRDSGLNPAEEVKFREWQARDRLHRDAVAELQSVWTAALSPQAKGQAANLAFAVRAVRQRRRRRSVAGVAALLAIAVWIGSFGLRARQRSGAAPEASRPVIRPDPPADFTVLLPQQNHLPDGSLIEHPALADVSIDYTGGRRHIVLRSGVARFSVAKDRAHPFVVSVGQVDFRAVGTVFVVEAGPNPRVFVTDGTVAVQQRGGPSLAVPAGQSCAVSGPEMAASAVHAQTFTAQEMRRFVEWAAPRVELSGAPLSEVAELLSRYGPAEFVLADQSLAALRVSGTLRCEETQEICQLLESGFGVGARREGKRIYLYALGARHH